MPRIEESVIIERPVEELFGFLTAPENDLLWVSAAVERQIESEGPIGVGTRIRFVDRVAGRRIEWRAEVTEYEPNVRTRIRSISGPMRVQGGKTFEPAQGGTRLTIELEAGSPIGALLGKLSDPFATRMLRRQIRADLARLKSVLEGRSRAGD